MNVPKQDKIYSTDNNDNKTMKTKRDIELKVHHKTLKEKREGA